MVSIPGVIVCDISYDFLHHFTFTYVSFLLYDKPSGTVTVVFPNVIQAYLLNGVTQVKVKVTFIHI